MNTSDMADTLRRQAQQFLFSDHPERIWFHRDALNVLADLETAPATPGVIAHANGAIETYRKMLECSR